MQAVVEVEEILLELAAQVAEQMALPLTIMQVQHLLTLVVVEEVPEMKMLLAAMLVLVVQE